MTKLFSSLAFAALAGGSLLAQPALAGGVNGVAVVNLDGAIAGSNAFKAAQTARQTTYKPQMDQAQARAQQIDAQLRPLAEKFQKDRAAGVGQATLAQEYETLQKIQNDGKQEIARIMEPEQLSEAYGVEQLNAKLGDSVKAAMQKQGVSLLLRREAYVYGSPAADMTQAVIDELNVEVPNVQIVPPAGWEPQEVRDQKAQAAAQAGSRGTGDTGGR